ncbi:ABC transporter substrate-binding protein [uncultured Bacteroides sp.]|uniref:ABC transporter substrate-binding protein n=1 Tax=uncultured Bacteroides sp. TaxID=162156 RepID=UPI002617D3FB|nr:ABC transporter substrate-binding protein [uncultured Bacteroides sp.]
MNRIILSANIVLIVLLLSACGGQSKTSFTQAGDTIRLSYAENLNIIKYNDYTVVGLRNPWDTLQTLHTYILIDKVKPQPDNLPEGTVVKVPLEQSLVYSSVHCGLIDELGAPQSIKGVCDLQYINLPFIQEGCKKGMITDAGNSMNPDIEKVIDMHSDAILLSPFENSGGYGRIEKLSIPIIECADYMETSALGRAEWMKFFGMLYGKEAEADSLFTQIENRYQSLKKQVADLPDKPKILSELKTGSSWYVPGGESTSGKLMTDAGGQYIFADIAKSGSVALSFETVFDKAQHADIWLFKYNQEKDKTYKELKSDYAPYANFDAYKKRRIYGCNTKYIHFYEDLPFHPEILLEDLIKIFHPGVLGEDSPKYFHKLAE